MKNTIKILFTFSLCFSAYGQSSNQKVIDTVYFHGQQKTIKYTDGSQLTQLVTSNLNVPSSKKTFNSAQDEIDHLVNYIANIELKKSSVANNEDMNSPKVIAWFVEMNEFIQKSQTRIEELQNQILQENNK